MSEFTNKYEQRVEKLTNYILGLVAGENGSDLLTEYQILETEFIPQDVLTVFDNIFHSEIEMEKMKTASNKLFNILYKNLTDYKKSDYPKGSIIDYLIMDNEAVKNQLTKTKSMFSIFLSLHPS